MRSPCPLPRLLLLAGATLLAATGAHAQTCNPMQVHNVRPDGGKLMVAAFTDAPDFNTRPATALQLRANAASMNFMLCGLSGPSVAVMLFQDTNGNGKLDRNVLGIPSEPWGASGKPSNFAPPSWDSTQVPLNGSPIVVSLSN